MMLVVVVAALVNAVAATAVVHLPYSCSVQRAHAGNMQLRRL